MELLYFFIENCDGIASPQEVSLTGEYSFTLSKYSKESRELELQIIKLHTFPSNFYSSNIRNITAFIGENGAGKTSFLEFLKRFYTSRLHYNDKFLAVLRFGEKIQVYHTLYEFIEASEDFESPLYKDEWQIKINYNSRDKIPICLYPLFSSRLTEIIELNKTKTIFYSGIFDLKGYPYPDKNDFIDISTNYLVEKDANVDNFSLPGKNILLRHKHKNILRQIKVVNSNLLDNLEFPPPKYISLIFDVVNFNIDDSRDIDFEDKKIFTYFKDRIRSEYSLINKTIKKGIDTDELLSSRALNHKCKLAFVEALIYNYFKNIDNGDYFDILSGVNISNYNKISIYDAAKEFFNSQIIVSSADITNLIESAYSIIDNVENTASLDEGSRKIEIQNKASVVELLSNYETYLESFNNGTSFGFISTEWHDMSSGEKAFLDLFSRLYDAKDQILRENSPEAEVETVCIILDEAEIGFHPEWQRKYLATLQNFLSYLFATTERTIFKNTKIQLFIASHSPFLVSDLPKSNIVFLRKNFESSLNYSAVDNEQTFGSNIHTLYSDSFFLKNTIGEFAKQKISNLIEYLNSKAKTSKKLNFDKESSLNLIEIIGEPLIKNQLQDMWNEKFQEQQYDTKGVDLITRIKELKQENKQLRDAAHKNRP